jgi:hypothetical protein
MEADGEREVDQFFHDVRSRVDTGFANSIERNRGTERDHHL